MDSTLQVSRAQTPETLRRSATVEVASVLMLPDGRLDTKNAAQYLGLSVKTLAMMRSRGDGPRYLKRGRIFYFREDLDAWLGAPGRRLHTAQRP